MTTEFAQTYPSHEWVTHVGIYTGNGMMVNATAQGDAVREMPVFTGYWLSKYAGAGRVRRYDASPPSARATGPGSRVAPEKALRDQ